MRNADEWADMGLREIRTAFGCDPARVERFRKYAAAGYTGLVLVRAGQWISYGWCSNLRSPCPPHLPQWTGTLGAYWIFGCHTRAQFRGRGFYKQLLRRLIALAYKDHASPRIYIDTHAENIPSRRAILASGFAPHGVFSAYRMWAPFVGYRIVAGRWHSKEPHPQCSSEKVILPAEPLAGEISYRNFAG